MISPSGVYFDALMMSSTIVLYQIRNMSNVTELRHGEIASILT